MLTSKDVYTIDINAKYLGIDVLLLMENSGRSVAEVVEEKVSPDSNILIIAGPGNNGGDGLVAARHLAFKHKVKIAFIGDERRASKLTKRQLEILRKISSIEIDFIKYDEDLEKLIKLLEESDVVVDAIFGVGLKGDPKGLFRRVIEIINKVKERKKYKVISVDVPSGLIVDEGKIGNPAIRPDIIVTFVDKKKGIDLFQAKVVVKNIGIPRDLLEIAGPGDLILNFPRRKDWSKKGDFGRVLVIGGSYKYTGAPVFSAMAALKSGVDLVFLYVPKGIVNVIRSFSPDLIAIYYEGEYLIVDAIEKLELDRYDSVLIGPGLGVEKETIEAVRKLVLKLIEMKKKVVIDADGLKAIKGMKLSKNFVVTPHAGELKIISNLIVSGDIEDRKRKAIEAAKMYDSIILLKGHVDVITDGERTKINLTGNPAMTVGGTGDVLAGLVAGFLAQGIGVFESAVSAAFLNGLAGDLAFEKYGYSMTASDVINEIPNAFKKTFSYAD